MQPRAAIYSCGFTVSFIEATRFAHFGCSSINAIFDRTGRTLIQYRDCSCINPIVYGFMSKHFRENFLSAACGGWWICCPRRGYRASVTRNASLSQTRSTSVRYVVWLVISLSLTYRCGGGKMFGTEWRNAHLSSLEKRTQLVPSSHFISGIERKQFSSRRLKILY